MSRLEAGLESSQMPYPAAIGFKFLFGELGYRFVKFTEYRSFVVGQCSGDWYRIGNMVPSRLTRIFSRSMSVRISISRSISGSSVYVPSNIS